MVCTAGGDVLDMDEVFSGHLQSVGDHVVLHSGVDLHDVTPLPPHVEVVDGAVLHPLWPGTDGKGVRPKAGRGREGGREGKGFSFFCSLGPAGLTKLTKVQ